MTTSENQTPENGDPQREGPGDYSTILTRLVRIMAEGIENESRAHNLEAVEFALLRVCMARKECTATELADVLPVDLSRISRIVNKLVRLGFLRRRRLRNDRRMVMLRLTDKGQELVPELDRRVREYDARLIEGITDREMLVFAETSKRILANYEAMKES